MGLTDIQTIELPNKIKPQRYHHGNRMDRPSGRYRRSFGIRDKRRLSMHMETGEGGKREIHISVIQQLTHDSKVHRSLLQSPRWRARWRWNFWDRVRYKHRATCGGSAIWINTSIHHWPFDEASGRQIGPDSPALATGCLLRPNRSRRPRDLELRERRWDDVSESSYSKHKGNLQWPQTCAQREWKSLEIKTDGDRDVSSQRCLRVFWDLYCHQRPRCH